MTTIMILTMTMTTTTTSGNHEIVGHPAEAKLSMDAREMGKDELYDILGELYDMLPLNGTGLYNVLPSSFAATIFHFKWLRGNQQLNDHWTEAHSKHAIISSSSNSNTTNNNKPPTTII